MRRIVLSLTAALVLGGIAPVFGFIGGPHRGRTTPVASPTKQIPSTFTNLQIIPADSTRAQVVGIMRNFASGLGVRCDHCHVGDNPDTLEGFDFASDAKETKRVARAMMRMVGEINGTFIPATGRAAESLIEVTCVTCHHGTTRPQTLGQVMTAAYEEGGGDAAVARYRELREQYYGSAVYDFGRGALTGLAESIAQEKRDLDTASRLFELNIEFFPDWGYNYYMLGQTQASAGDRPAAIASLERAIELEPDNNWYKDALARLRQP